MNSFLFDACSFAENRIGQRHVNPQTSLHFGFRRCHPLATTSPHPSEARRPRCGQDNAAKTKSPVRLWQIRNIGAIYNEEVSNSA